ncbi:PAS and ANTAR domain-containing protein [Promicromonospora sp. NPDC060204]|uniref:PAS and ANTAR domain-containing protein n=1 Tax=Promicromonospora sp. NPDC060204 TaxID=3347071 RepID=UPI00365F7C52
MSAEPLEIERALTLGANHTIGHYRYDLATGEWWWSDEVYRIHGFEPGDVVPTTALILAHKHPEDRSRVSRILAHAATTGEPFSSVHRIMDAKGQERTLTVIGRGRRDPGTHRVTELVGYFVDVTAGFSRQANEAADTSIKASAATRAPIEQAKGIVAIALGVDPEAAFEHMRVTSNVTNVAVRDVARQIIEIASTQGSLQDVRTYLVPSDPAATTP